MHQNSPTAISDFKNFPGEKPPDPRFQGGAASRHFSPAVWHESQVCYHSATQSSQFDVSFPKKLLKFVATRGKIFSLKFTKYRLAQVTVHYLLSIKPRLVN